MHIAFYFEWLEFYTKWLTAPTAIGVLIYFSKAVMAVDHFQNIIEVSTSTTPPLPRIYMPAIDRSLSLSLSDL